MFEIKATNLHWMGTLDEPLDLCLHGDAWARIGDESFEFKNATVSATAFYLLRSLTQDHVMYQMPTQLLPCCGHDMRIWKGELIICGCPNGIDWSVIHENGQVKLITESQKETVLSLDEYRETVFAFADEIEAFYKNSKEKAFECKEDQETYPIFWEEWRKRRYS